MNSRQKSNLQYLLDICINEHNISEVNITKYEQAIDRIQNLTGESDEILIYEDTIKDLSNIFDILRNFNLEVAKYRLTFFENEFEYGLFDNAQQQLRPVAPEDAYQDSAEDNTEVIEPVSRYTNSLSNLQIKLKESMKKREYKEQNNYIQEYTDGIIPIKSFNYPTNDFSKYLSAINYEGKCIISYVENVDTKIFYLIEATSADNKMSFIDLNVLQSFCHASHLINLPDPNVVFGLFIDNCMFRAVRETINDQNQHYSNKIKIFLLDVGEILEIVHDDTAVSFYALPESYENLPAQAYKAKLVKVNGNPDGIDAGTYLKNNKYTIQKFKINSINNFILYVELTMDDNNNIDNGLEEPLGACCMEMTEEINKENNPIKLTQQQIDILNEEPLNTQNAMVAVMGYDPQDEKRICKFYNKDINGCFKGNNCRMEHVEILKDGWTRDRIPSRISLRIPEIRPPVGTTLKITPTHIVNVGVFYAHILDLTNSSTKLLPTLREMLRKMNMIEIKSKYKKLTKLPGELELVLGLYTDKQWYRCRIVRIQDDGFVKVFYLDYGNCHVVSADDLREWDQRFDYYPFQAYAFRIDNCVKLDENNAEAIGRFAKLILNKQHTAKVTCNINELYITMLDKNGFDIGEILCGMNYAKPKEITTINVLNQMVPL